MKRAIIDENFKIKTFSVECDQQFSAFIELILKSFRFKLYYYVVDDLLYFSKSNPNEFKYILQILNSTVIFLQNNLYVNYFDIYVYDIKINQALIINRFIDESTKQSKGSNYIVIKLAYKVRPFRKKLEINW